MSRFTFCRFYSVSMLVLSVLLFSVVVIQSASAFVSTTTYPTIPSRIVGGNSINVNPRVSNPLRMFDNSSNNEEEELEKARVKIIQARRNEIRGVLRSAERIRTFRLKNGWVPEINPETGKPDSGDGGKLALSLTAFVVAAGAIALRIGGRAALVSAVGLDFLTDSPELKQNLDTVLNTAESMDVPLKIALFTLSWTAVKVLCFDAGGVVLALSAGILFGGVVQGALLSAAAATVGSSVAFAMAKLDTPVRKKALELLDEYPSLRGIEKVVAQDGLKAVLTLRLAPILPIPVGLYNYIYGVTNVPFFSFAGGIFLGSLKPYFLDSYLGYFGKDLVQGNVDQTGLQDILLLVALGFSVLIGVFASQLAAETWDSVLQEVEAEKKAKGETGEEEMDDVKREFLGITLPEFLVEFQKNWKQADINVNELVLSEVQAKAWNYTKLEPPPAEKDPANFAGSPELVGANKGFDFGLSVCEGLVLTPICFKVFGKYSDPLYNEEEDEELQNLPPPRVVVGGPETEATRQELLSRLDQLQTRAKRRIGILDERILLQESNLEQ